ncbi:CMRF35-like molecule 6 [Lepus europaeus]|uniref:CMRF35-like molecule 6 n=1 Tax=Lepus europaeus TaxID=9983 RepID=UPI002B47527A|nr:CMRF35-like molecule 6 [Lepus europaeus]
MAAGDTCAGDTPSRRRAVWLSPALLLLLVQGCFCLSGPSTVRGTEGGSLSVQCRYAEKHRALAKFWCSLPCWPGKEIVRTKPPEVEARSGRVSIRDHPANLTFTVTLENLSSEDAGTYQCGVDEPLRLDTNFLVTVFVSPAPTTALSYVGSTVPVMTRPAHTGEKPPDPSPHPRSLLSSVHGLLLVFLKLPLLLAMLAAVLWAQGCVAVSIAAPPARPRHPCLQGGEIVRTKPPEVEARSGRVSIRDHPANLTFTVTLENLSGKDAGTYQCGVDEPWKQEKIFLLVFVSPAPTTALSYVGSTVPVMTRPAHTGEKPPDPSPHPWSLLGSVHGLLLVFLKLPLLLAMLAAVLWVNRPQRGPGRGQVS